MNNKSPEINQSDIIADEDDLLHDIDIALSQKKSEEEIKILNTDDKVKCNMIFLTDAAENHDNLLADKCDAVKNSSDSSPQGDSLLKSDPSATDNLVLEDQKSAEKLEKNNLSAMNVIETSKVDVNFDIVKTESDILAKNLEVAKTLDECLKENVDLSDCLKEGADVNLEDIEIDFEDLDKELIDVDADEKADGDGAPSDVQG